MKIQKILKCLKLNSSGWCSVYINLGFLLLAIYTLLLTDLKEAIVASLNKEVLHTKSEVVRLSNDVKDIQTQKVEAQYQKNKIEEEINSLNQKKKSYVMAIRDTVIEDITSSLKKQYNDYNNLAEEAIFFQDLEKWAIKESEEEKNGIRLNKRISPPEIFAVDYNIEYLRYNSCSDCPEAGGKFSSHIFVEQKKLLFVGNKTETASDLIKSLEKKLMPEVEKVKIQQFLNKYSKRSIYNSQIYPSIKEFDSLALKNKGLKVKENIKNLKNDLPNLEAELKVLFDSF